MAERNMTRRRTAAILALAVFGGGALFAEQGMDGTTTDSTEHVVTIQNMQFEPAELIVKRGSRVVWINKDLFPHTATAKTFDSGSIEANASWSYVAREPGDHAYLCAFHPTMKGRLIVR